VPVFRVLVLEIQPLEKDFLKFAGHKPKNKKKSKKKKNLRKICRFLEQTMY
jgi:hypothetical protein